jgi:hypothetical protein
MCWILGYNAVYFVESQPTFRRNISPQSSGSKEKFLLPPATWFLARLIPWPRKWRECFSPKRRLTFNGLHGVISQNVVLLIGAAFHCKRAKIKINLQLSMYRLLNSETEYLKEEFSSLSRILVFYTNFHKYFLYKQRIILSI